MVGVMDLFTSLLLTFLACQPALSVFLPISIRNDLPSLMSRDEQMRHCLRPVPELDLHYVEEYQYDNPYLITVTPSHNESSYLAVEEFEHLLSDFTCTPLSSDASTNLILRFNTHHSMILAWDIWTQHSQLLFVTHHVSCNPFNERAIYRTSTITYDFDDLIATISGYLVTLGDSVEAHSHLRISGGQLSPELRKRLRHRDNLDYKEIAKRDPETSQWVIDLNENFNPREEIITIDSLKLSCIDCNLVGKLTAAFTLDIDFEDTLTFWDNDVNPFNQATLKLESTEAIDADLNFEIEGTLKEHVQCTFPIGGCSHNGLGKRFQPGISQPGFTVGGLDVAASIGLGLSVGFDAMASVNFTVPVTVNTPKGESAWKDFFSGDSGDNLTKDLVPHVGVPIFHSEDTEARICAFVSIGPSVSLAATIAAVQFDMSLAARLDLPRVTFCLSLAQDVDSGCNSNGPFDQAVDLSANVSAGLVISGNIHAVVPVASFNTELGPLYHTWPFLERCFEVGGSDSDNDKNTPPTPGNTTNSAPPDDQPSAGNSTGNNTGPGYEVGVYDCSTVAPSPGGQPCGDVVMQCTDAYHWSCGNGEQGVVPPGTFCACGAFRYPGWTPPSAATPACSGGIYCVSETLFSVCSPAGIEPPQPVSAGTVCRDEQIVAV